MLQKTPGPEYRGGRQRDYANEKGGSEKAPFRRKKYKAAGGAQANSAQRLSITPGPVSGFRFQVSHFRGSRIQVSGFRLGCIVETLALQPRHSLSVSSTPGLGSKEPET
jgi:hypothetical protein